MFDDIRDAVRILHRSPRTAVTVWLVMTLSLSAATVVFTVVDHVALRQLPFAEPDQLVAIKRVEGADGLRTSTNAPQDYLAWQARASLLEPMAASAAWPSLRMPTGDHDVAFRTQRLTSTFLPAIGVAPVLGRGFTEAEAIPGQDAAVLLSDRAWREYFDGDPSVVGRQVSFGDRTREVVGVMPPGFSYPLNTINEADLWIPFAMRPADRDPASPGRGYSMDVIARLSPGATRAQAQAQLSQIVDDLDTEYGRRYWKNARPVVMPLREAVVGPAGGWLLLALGAVGVVVLLASANVANLLLARAGHRSRELAVRAALGASAGRLRRVVLLESLTIASLAGVAALGVTWLGIRAVVAWLPTGIGRVSSVALDARVFIVSLTVAAVAGLVAGLVPARAAARSDLTRLLRAGAVPAGQSSRAALVVVQVAFVVVLVFATASFVASFIRVVTTDMGFDYQDRVVFVLSSPRLALVREGTRDPQSAAVEWLDDLVSKVRALPGVQSAGYIDQGRPLGGGLASYQVRTTAMRDKESVGLDLHEVTPGYQDAAGLRLVEGRLLSESDRQGALPVMVLSQPAARRLFPGQSAVGQAVEFRGLRRVVGVVDGVRTSGPETERRMAMYLPLAQGELRAAWSRTMVVRSRGPVASIVGPVAALIAPYLAPGQSLQTPQFMADEFSRVTASRRFQTRLMSAFGALALLIGAFGIYSVISALVVQQTKEIGVRMALGASGFRIIRMVLGRTLALVAGGLGAGLFASSLLTGWLSSLVFEIQPASVSILGVVVLVVLGTAVASALAPALRAARVNPIHVLRAD